MLMAKVDAVKIAHRHGRAAVLWTNPLPVLVDFHARPYGLRPVSIKLAAWRENHRFAL